MVTETSLWGWKCLPSASSRQSCHSFQCLLNICDTNNTFLEPLWTLRVRPCWLMDYSSFTVRQQCWTATLLSINSKILQTITPQLQHSPNKRFNSWFTFRNGLCVFYPLLWSLSPWFQDLFLHSVKILMLLQPGLPDVPSWPNQLQNKWKQLSTMG